MKRKFAVACSALATLMACAYPAAGASAASHPASWTWTGHTFREVGQVWELDSTNGVYRAVWQGDGNFVVYHSSKAIWSSGAALKCLYLVTRSLDPGGTGRTRWTRRWKPVINAFAITFGGRWPNAESY